MEYEVINTALLLILFAGAVWFTIKAKQETDAVSGRPSEVEANEYTPPYTIVEFQAMTKAQLLATAAENGVQVTASWTKARITAALIEAFGL